MEELVPGGVLERLKGYLYEEVPADPREEKLARSLLSKLESGGSLTEEEQELYNYLAGLGPL